MQRESTLSTASALPPDGRFWLSVRVDPSQLLIIKFMGILELFEKHFLIGKDIKETLLLTDKSV